MTYLDTSSLIALYYPEDKTDRLTSYLFDHPSPLLFTWLHEMEFTNGLQLKLFRKEATATLVAATLTDLHADVQSGVLHQMPLANAVFFATALRLSTTHSPSIGTRTLDLLHIAAALTLQATAFITNDDRQAQAATAEGLKVVRV